MGVFLRPVTYDDKKAGRKNTHQVFIHIYLCNCTIQKRGRKNTPIKKNSTKKEGVKIRPCLFRVIFNRVIIQFNDNVYV